MAVADRACSRLVPSASRATVQKLWLPRSSRSPEARMGIQRSMGTGVSPGIALGNRKDAGITPTIE